jgi:hypothetical protein
MIREISRKFPDTRKIEVRNNLDYIDFKARCVVTAAGNIYIDINHIDEKYEGEHVVSEYFKVIRIEEVDF